MWAQHSIRRFLPAFEMEQRTAINHSFGNGNAFYFKNFHLECLQNLECDLEIIWIWSAHSCDEANTFFMIEYLKMFERVFYRVLSFTFIVCVFVQEFNIFLCLKQVSRRQKWSKKKETAAISNAISWTVEYCNGKLGRIL